jgi:hypothetical protein
MNRIAVDSIQKAGVYIDSVVNKGSKELFALIPKTKVLKFYVLTHSMSINVAKEIETYTTELPHLKVFEC